MTMRAGDLDRRIRIERATSITDAFGAEIPTWAELDTVRAAVLPISDGERWRAGEVAASVTTRFQVRWGFDVRPTDRIVYDGRIYEISGIKEIDRRVGQEITAAARAD